MVMERNDEYLINGPITPAVISDMIFMETGNENAGAYSIFMGKVRADRVDGKTVKKIEYSAYREMVVVEALKIKNEVATVYDDIGRIKILHSVGDVNAGEISLFVLVASAHREQNFKACREVVERIKQRLPVWKKEIFDDNSHRWI
jgi:molybdopterin synthase catalytic subunit